jgi:transcriptional regulator with XRE-family HTH domain
MHKTQAGARGIPVWGERLKELRKRKGWTQQELACRSGYCERLIRKAELHGNVSEETLEVLAITLSDSQLQVTVEELSLSARIPSMALSQAFFAADSFSRNRLVQCSQAEIEIDCRRIVDGLPLQDQYFAHSGVSDWYTPIFCLLTSEQVSIEEKIQVDNSVHGYLHATCVYTSETTASQATFDLDFRFHLADYMIQKIVWLSSLEELVPFAAEWDQLVKAHYQTQIKLLYQGDYAQTPA